MIEPEAVVEAGSADLRFAERVDRLLEPRAEFDEATKPLLGFEELRLGLGLVAVFCISTAALMSAWAFVPVLLGWESSAIVSNSMAPRVERGDVVVFRPASEETLDTGAVIMFFGSDPDQAIVHRIVDIDFGASTYATRGDANTSVDSDAVPFASVQGVGALLVPLVGWPIAWANEGNIAMLGLFLAGFFAVVWLAQGVATEVLVADVAPGFGPLAMVTLAGESATEPTLIPLDLRARLGLASVPRQ
jgi:signal peptidase I